MENDKELLQESLCAIALELFRFQQVFQKVLGKLTLEDQKKYRGQFSWFAGKVNRALEGAGLRLCSLEGQIYDPGTATVITVPAAFNQVKKDATLQAAKLAGIGKVALMQEPVAAIMSVMQMGAQEGIFLVYDLGGGTFDVCVAESAQGKVNLLAHGGIEMCGGRDIDRMIFHQMVLPWLRENFSLPEDFLVNSRYRSFCRIAQWAAEQAKMELSAAETSTIALSEAQARTLDEEGQELYLDIPLTRQQVDERMSGLLEETIEVTRQTLHKAGLSASDLERIVFIGGSTQYKPLRDQVCFALSVKAGIQANPMTQWRKEPVFLLSP